MSSKQLHAPRDGIYRSKAKSVESFPDHMDLYSFMFEDFRSLRPDVRQKGTKLFIDDETGEGMTFEETKERTDFLSVGLSEISGVGRDTVVAIFSANTLDYGVMIWATHRLGGIVSCANPAFQPSELSYQLEASRATVVFVNESAKQQGYDAAQKANIPRDRVIVVQDPKQVRAYAHENEGRIQRRIDGDAWTLSGLVEYGKEAIAKKGAKATLDKSRTLMSPGEAKTKLAFLSFSSGTTGLPKGVAIQHAAPIANILQFLVFNELQNKLGDEEGGRYRAGVDVMLGVLPFFHIYGLVLILHASFWGGLPNVVIPKFKGIAPMLASVLRYRISIWPLVPPQVVLFCKSDDAKPYHEKVRSIVHFVMVGAAPLSDDLSRQFEKLLPNVDWGQGYGMTETCTLTLMHPLRMRCIEGSAGRLISNTEARIVTPEGRDCGFDEPGELWIRGPQNTLGYSNNEQATKEMFLDGNWVRTGDEVRINNDGDFFVVDRLKELIKVKGFQVAPAELEGWLLNHSDVSDACVIGVPDESSGERPLAYISLSTEAKQRLKEKSGSTEEQKLKESVLRHVSDHKIRYKHLKGVEIFAIYSIDAIPKTPSGKILRRTLRDQAKRLASSTEGHSSKL